MIAKRRLITAAAALMLLPWASGAWGQHGSSASGIVTASDVNLREGPGRDRDAIAALDEGARVTVLTRKGEWARVRTRKGTTGWTLAEFVRTSRSKAHHTDTDTSAPLVAKVATAEPDHTAASAGTTAAPAQQPTPPAAPPATQQDAPVVPPTASDAAHTENTGALAGTRSDPVPTTQDSPAAAVGNASHFLLYLLPVLALIVLGIRGLKSLQQRTGSIGSLGSAGLKLNLGTRPRGPVHSIRVVETARVGAATIFLVDVRGRLLLLGTNGNSVRVLSNLSGTEPAGGDDFREILNEAAVEMQESHTDPGLAGVMGALDGRLRQTRESVNNSASRVRHWTEL